MPLTTCPDCKRKISTRSEHCIFCGCPAIFYRDEKLCEPDERRPFSLDALAAKPEYPKMLTIREAAKDVGIPENTLRGMVKRNEIPYIHSGTRVYINLARLREHLNDN